MYDSEPVFTGSFAGCSGVGKTSLGHALTGNCDMAPPQPTVGIGEFTVYLNINDTKRKLLIKDTAGQEVYDSITKNHFRNIHFAIIVYSINDKKSFTDLDKYFGFLEEGSPEAKAFIIGNKVDLADLRQVTYDEAKAYADQKGAEYFEVSATNGTNIEEFREFLATTQFSSNYQTVTHKLNQSNKNGCCN